MRDPYAPLRMPLSNPAPPVRIEARRHLVLSLWLCAMMAVATVTVLVARPAIANDQAATTVTQVAAR